MAKLAVGILLFDGVEVLDFAGPFEVFSRTRLAPGVESRRSEESAPFQVFTVAASPEPVRATGGLRVIPHFDFAGAPRADVLVVPGGFGPRARLTPSRNGLRFGRPLASLLLGLGIAVSASADPAPVDPALFQDLRWRLIGPFRGGRVLAVAGVPGEREHFYFGSVDGGVWETTDAGRTWRPIFDGQPMGSIGALALAPSNPRILYVGTGEADMRSDIAQGNGAYKSTD